MTPRFVLAGLLLALAMSQFGCADADTLHSDRSTSELNPSMPEEFSPLHMAVYQERSLLARPSEKSHRSRFRDGWRPRPTGLLLPAGVTGTIEVVTLNGADRTLELELDASLSAEQLVLTHDNETLDYQLEGLEVSVHLPPITPTMLIEVQAASDLTIVRGGLDDALPAGDLHFEDRRLRQSGWSAASFVLNRECAQKALLTLEPPQAPGPDQWFRAVLSGVEIVAWGTEDGKRVKDASPLTAEFLIPTGLSQLQLEAGGTGPSAAWQWTQVSVSEGGCASTADSKITLPVLEPPRVVVVYVMDALRADVAGSEEVMPIFRGLAREGREYQQHRSVAPNTLPSTKALFTGQVWREHGGWKLPATDPATLAEVFAEAGYRTALFSSNPWISETYGATRGFETVESVPVDWEGTNNDAEALVGRALNWLDRVEGVSAIADQPPAVFLYIHVLNPHNPYTPPDEFLPKEIVGPLPDGSTQTLMSLRQKRLALDKRSLSQLTSLYRANATYADYQLGRLVEELENRFGAESLFVAATSDHGEELGEHGGVLHGFTLYEEMIRIPLVLWGPGLIEPKAVRQPTTTLDLHAVLLGLVGRQPSDDGSPLTYAAAASVPGGIYSVVSPAGHKLIWSPRVGKHWGQGSGIGRSRRTFEFEDLGSGRPEAAHPLMTAWLYQELRAWSMSPGPGAERVEADASVVRELEALGYVE